MLNYLKEEQIDRFLALWAIPSGIAAYYLFRKFRTPYDIWCLGSDIWKHRGNLLTKPLLLKILRNAQNVYADGHNFSSDVEELSGRPCQFLPSSRNVSHSVNDWGEQKNYRKTFIFIGRYHYNKGPDVLIQAIKRLPKQINEAANFIFYGTGTLKEQLIETVTKFNMENVSISDVIAKEHVYGVLTKAHFLIIPSRFDSIPVVLSDALQCNTPVIGADIGDMGDIIRDYKIGYTFERENDADLHEKIIKAFYDNKDDYLEAVKNANKIFSVDGAVKEFNKNLER